MKFQPDIKETISVHSRILADCFHNLTGKNLLEGLDPASDTYAEDLFYAPFAVVSHGKEENPIFNYGNQVALDLFELSWEEFTKMPSRKSAEPINQEERQRLLNQVSKSGFIENYQGIRISRTGKRFMIKNATVWNLFNEENQNLGQAACFYNWYHV